MNFASRSLRFFVSIATTALFGALGACGGDDGPGPGEQRPGTAIGAAGGTVIGPDGTKVVVPPGALATDTAIAIERTAAGAPPVPGSFSASGPTFAFTPHGTTFAAPVTITLPFDPASVPAGRSPVLLKTGVGNSAWEEVTNAVFDGNSVTAQVTGFSFVQAAHRGLSRNDPARAWEFVLIPGNGFPGTVVPGAAGSGTLVGGLLEQLVPDLGPAIFDRAIRTSGATQQVDGRAAGLITSTPDGATYGVFVEAPFNQKGGTRPIGAAARLEQSQSFVKNASDAFLTYTVTTILIDATDFNGNIPDPTARAAFRINGETSLAVRAYKTPGVDFYDAAAIASVTGSGSSWAPSAFTDSLSRNPLWSIVDFDFSTTTLFDSQGGNSTGCRGVGAVLKLKGPRTYRVDLSSIAVGEEFTLNVVARAEATNRRGGGSRGDCEGSSASAFLKDPIEVGGTTIAFSGLEPTNRPLASPRAPVVVPPAACVPGAGPGAAGGTLQFSAARYAADESQGATVTVSRTGGSSGAATATFATSDGTAVGGTDYTPVAATVFFGDGEDGERALVVPIVQDLASGEPDKTVVLTLSQPGGCGTLGPQATAELTIVDDDAPPPPPSFTVGGTVSGLVGTGLVLRDQNTRQIAPGNGAFAFPGATRTGLPYDVTVVTQPTNPSQVCTITNGSGTIGNANVTNVAVDCVTPAANGALDPGFGAAGKVISAFGGDESAMALQPDGKIVMVNGGSDFTVARYNRDGSVDAGFGSGGVVTTDFGSNQDSAQAVAIQADGKIVVAGISAVGRTSRNLFNFDFAIARYNPDGSLDPTFGSGGKVTTDFNGETDRALALTIQPDGKIVVVGSASTRGTVSDIVDFGVARYDANGALDAGFGNGGKVTTDLAGGVDIAQNVALQPNGAIVVSGPRTNAGDPGLDHAGLVRYRVDGSLDTAFGAAGKVVLANTRVGDALAIQPDGKILVAGSVPVGAFPATSSQFALMRLGADGNPDTGFGANGVVTTPFTTQDDFGRAVALQADGKILVAGQSSNRSNPDFAVARYNAHGTPDAAFGSGGKLTVDFFGSFDGADSVAVQPDGSIVLGGFARNGTRTGFALVRVLP